MNSRERPEIMNQFVKPMPAKNVPKVVAVTMWLCAVGAPAFVIHTNLVEAARRDAQSDVIAQVATVVKSSSTSREEVLRTVALHEQEIGDARYIRAANRLGIPMEWKSLFGQIKKRNDKEQKKAARIIAEECGLAADTTLNSEQTYLAGPAPMVPSPISIRMPLPVAVGFN
jgi:hypothetical protein